MGQSTTVCNLEFRNYEFFNEYLFSTANSERNLFGTNKKFVVFFKREKFMKQIGENFWWIRYLIRNLKPGSVEEVQEEFKEV